MTLMTLATLINMSSSCQSNMSILAQNCIRFQNTAKKYETSTGSCHRFIPSVSQEFDCRVKANIKPELLFKDIAFRDEDFKTFYSTEYPRKVGLGEQLHRPPPNRAIEYMRNEQEKFFQKPPPPLELPLSEMKDSFRMNYHKPEFEESTAPCQVAKCHIVRQGCEQQPAIPPHRKGFWRWTDPYLTNYKSDYLPHNEADDKITEKIVTFYNVSEFSLPPASGNKTMYDKCTFKNVLPGRLMARSQDRVPYFGMQSEYQDHYVKQTCSYLYPHLQDRCTELEDSLPPASRWQNLAPPGMYCSEYCNIGGLPVRRTVDTDKHMKELVRTKNCVRI